MHLVYIWQQHTEHYKILNEAAMTDYFLLGGVVIACSVMQRANTRA